MTRHFPLAAPTASARAVAGRVTSGPLRAGLLAALIGTALLPALPALAQDAAPKATAPAAAASQGDDPVLATVNGQPIRRSDVTAAAAELAPNLPQQIQGAARDEYVLGFLIDLNAMAQAAEAQKLYETEEFKREMDFIRKRVLMQAILTKATKDALTDAAMQQTYEEAVKQQKPEKEVRARHILFRADPNNKEAQAAAEKKAQDVEAQLKKGADFAKLAGELTEDPSGKDDGGDLGFFTKEQMVPEFAEVAFELKPGEVSKPVKTQFGWHVIKLEEERERPVPTLDEVKPQIEQFLAQKAQAEAVQKTREAAKVEKTEAAPKPGDLINAPAATPATPTP